MFIAGLHSQLLSLCFSKSVGVEEMSACLRKVEDLVKSMKFEFCLLIDLSGLDTMDRACAGDLGRIMDLCNEKGVSRIVSVVPDPTKDIGLRLLSLFHFKGRVQIQLHGNLPDAIGSLPGNALALERACP
jgi:anti-anti-sigma regulatory factor